MLPNRGRAMKLRLAKGWKVFGIEYCDDLRGSGIPYAIVRFDTPRGLRGRTVVLRETQTIASSNQIMKVYWDLRADYNRSPPYVWSVGAMQPTTIE